MVELVVSKLKKAGSCGAVKLGGKVRSCRMKGRGCNDGNVWDEAVE